MNNEVLGMGNVLFGLYRHQSLGEEGVLGQGDYGNSIGFSLLILYLY